jgi:hypothetical protein
MVYLLVNSRLGPVECGLRLTVDDRINLVAVMHRHEKKGCCTQISRPAVMPVIFPEACCCVGLIGYGDLLVCIGHDKVKDIINSQCRAVDTVRIVGRSQWRNFTIHIAAVTRYQIGKNIV